MINMLRIFFDPGSLQMMTVFSIMLLGPLEKRKNWTTAATICLLLGFALGIGTGIRLVPGRRLLLHRWLVIPSNTIMLLVSYAVFRLCTRLTRMDAIYGVTCVYIIQHFIFCLRSIIWGHYGLFPLNGMIDLIVTWCVVFLIGGTLSRLINRRLPYRGHYDAMPQRVVMMGIIVFLIAFVLTGGIYIIEGDSNVMNLYYDLCVCILLLGIMIGQRKEVNLLAMVQTEQRLRRQMQAQYELSKDNIDTINRKCHNLKHQIEALRFVKDDEQRKASISEIEHAVSIYDIGARTGNEVLDTVLTEKALQCEKNGIAWTCLADGSVLQFLAPVDLYTMMGNALDNAIEASCKISGEQKTIRVIIRKECGAAFIQISNYYDQIGTMRDGLPETLKEDTSEHGYGLPSIREIVERYDGILDIDAEGRIFNLNILIPCEN